MVDDPFTTSGPHLIWNQVLLSIDWPLHPPPSGVHTYGQYLPLISNSSHYSLYFTPLSKNWNIGVVLPHHMPEFWYVMKKGSKSIIRFSGGSIWKQWERNLWRCRAAFIFLSNIFMSQACYWTTFKNEPVNMGSIPNSIKYWQIKNYCCCFSCWCWGKSSMVCQQKSDAFYDALKCFPDSPNYS